MAEQNAAGEPALDRPLGETGLGFDSMAVSTSWRPSKRECGVTVPGGLLGAQAFKDLSHLIEVIAKGA